MSSTQQLALKKWQSTEENTHNVDVLVIRQEVIVVQDTLPLLVADGDKLLEFLWSQGNAGLLQGRRERIRRKGEVGALVL